MIKIAIIIAISFRSEVCFARFIQKGNKNMTNIQIYNTACCGQQNFYIYINGY